jgi:hypothetical protein
MISLFRQAPRIFAAVKDDLERSQDAVDVPKDIVVPEAYDAEAPLAEIRRSAPVDLRVVLAAVGLDDQLALEAGEIGNEGADAVLNPEFQAETATSQSRPQEPLGIGCVTS